MTDVALAQKRRPLCACMSAGSSLALPEPAIHAAYWIRHARLQLRDWRWTGAIDLSRPLLRARCDAHNDGAVANRVERGSMAQFRPEKKRRMPPSAAPAVRPEAELESRLATAL